MEIQNYSSINFNANLVTRTTRYYKTGKTPKTEIMEVFKLNKSDIPFAEKCCNELSKHHRRDLVYLQKKMKFFFASFLQDKTSQSNDYYLAVKNNKEISGGIISIPFRNAVFISDAFSMCPKDYNIDILTYAFLSGTKADYPCASFIETNNRLKGLNDQSSILFQDIPCIKRNITSFYRNLLFEKGNSKNVSLDDVFGTKDLEIEVNPHLK